MRHYVCTAVHTYIAYEHTHLFSSHAQSATSVHMMSKPKPTPDPPPSLVNLLQSDSTVLDYFSALQANIDYDLQVWKNEAVEGKKEINRLNKQLKKYSQRPTIADTPRTAKNDAKEVSAQNVKRKHIDVVQECMNRAQGKKKSKSEQTANDESDDDAFLLELYGEYKPEASTKVRDHGISISDESLNEHNLTESTHSCQRKIEWFSSIIVDLDQCLKKLGVNLVKSHRENKIKPDSNEHVDTKIESQPSLSMEPTRSHSKSSVRRGDVDVSVDIFTALRLSIRCRHSFSPSNFYPCYLESKDPIHPAFHCIQLICRLLSILELCSQSYFGDNKWYTELNCRAIHGKTDDLSNQENDQFTEELIIGLRGRNLMHMIMSSLEGEMCRHWSIADKHLLEKTAMLPVGELEAVPTLDNGNASRDVNVTSSVMQGRLFQLAERASIARIISSIHQTHRDYQQAASIAIHYVVQFTPIISADKYIYGPCMSLCILEALLAEEALTINTRNDTIQHRNDSRKVSWFGCFLKQLDQLSAPYNISAGSILGESLSMSVSLTAYMYTRRSYYDDVKTRGISSVELAAYSRLLERESSWLCNQSCDMDYHDTLSKKVKETLDIIYDERDMDGSAVGALSTALMLYFVLAGDLLKISNVLKNNLSRWDNGLQLNQQHQCLACISACCKAYVIVEKYLVNESTVSFIDSALPPSECLRQYIEKNDHESTEEDFMLYLCIVRCSIFLSDGNLANKAVEYILKPSRFLPDRTTAFPPHFHELQEFGSQYPLVRVINLERRSDRLRNFLHQARHEQLLVMLAVSPLFYSTQDLNKHVLFYGQHAFDGNGTHLDLEKFVSRYIASDLNLSSYVSTHWRPNDLKAFDTFARGDDSLVRMSPSERACALSHIGSWIGVERSVLGLQENAPSLSHDAANANILKLFQTSGFACGPALIPENANIPPTPVFVIMEDDALLVDRFSDRLNLLLRQLPRDFHFCSLGYGR